MRELSRHVRSGDVELHYLDFGPRDGRPPIVFVPGLTDVAHDYVEVLGEFGRRVLVLEADGASIRMAPPFSGVPTPHVADVAGNRYFANCAWDVLGIAAAFRKPATVHSACAQSGAPLRLRVGLDGPEPSDWLFHCLVPAAQWWDDIVFT